MKKISNEQIGEYVDKFIQDLKKEFFKVEVLQDYSAIDDCPSLQDFKEGKKQEGIKLLEAEIEKISDWNWFGENEGLVKRRVHIVKLPFTPYIEWEIEWYRRVNIPKVGEQIFLIKLEDVKGLNIPEGDTLIFDDKIVMSHVYDIAKGDTLSSQVFDNPQEVEPFLRLKEELLVRALPLEEFLRNVKLPYINEN